MTTWQSFLEAVERRSTPIIVVLLLVCILGLIRELTKREHGNGG